MGVTVGAVYKWEVGMSIPEVRMLVEIAEFFEISIDALLGYEQQHDSVRDSVIRIQQRITNKDFEEAEKEVEKAPMPAEVGEGPSYNQTEKKERKGDRTKKRGSRGGSRRKKGEKKSGGFDVDLKGGNMGGMMEMLGGFSVLRLSSMMGMMNISFTKEELLALWEAAKKMS